MKQVLSILLACVFIAQSFTGVGILVYYQVNKTFISQQLCENRNKPEMHCNGHCYLSKQLSQLEEREQKQVNNIIKEKHEVLTKISGMGPSLFLNETVDNIFHAATVFYPQYNPILLLKPPAA